MKSEIVFSSYHGIILASEKTICGPLCFLVSKAPKTTCAAGFPPSVFCVTRFQSTVHVVTRLLVSPRWWMAPRAAPTPRPCACRGSA